MRKLAEILKAIGWLALNLLIAVIGTAVLESPLARSRHPKTIGTVFLNAYLLSALIACVLGFLIFGKWRIRTARGIWVIGVGLFLIRLALLSLSASPSSLWSHFSGAACVSGSDPVECTFWFLLTVLTIRTIFYSVGAWIAWLVIQSGKSAKGESLLNALLVRPGRLPLSPDDGSSGSQ